MNSLLKWYVSRNEPNNSRRQKDNGDKYVPLLEVIRMSRQR